MKKTAVLPALLLISALLSAASPSPSPPLNDDQKVTHLLNRMGFGARPGDVDRVRQMGLDKYIEQQLHPERIDTAATEERLASLASLKLNTAEILEKYPQPNQILRQMAGGDQTKRPDRRELRDYLQKNGLNQPQKLLQELQAQKLVRAVYSEQQLQEVMADFWFNHFNIFWGKGQDRWLTTDFEMNAIRPNSLGTFHDLLTATAKSPAMLFYLDNHLSSSPDARVPLRPNARRKPGINENYARELMELHTMGVDGGYTQKDVQDVARAFTGWTIDQRGRNGFIFRPQMHDNAEKNVLGHKIGSGGGIRDGEAVLQILSDHPATARFISTKLVQRFVSDDPPQSLVDRVAAAYMKTDGDIREMLRTIFTSSEFYSADAYRAKTKSPFELAASAIRALAGDTDGSMQLVQVIARMGQPMYQYQAPTGFPDRAEQWISNGALLERLNFAVALCSNKIPGTQVQLPGGNSGGNSEDVISLAAKTLLGSDLSAETRTALEGQLQSGDTARVPKAFALVMGSPEFQKH